jgi:hypothetical protein
VTSIEAGLKAKIDDEFTFRVLKTTTKPNAMVWDGSSTLLTHFQVKGSYTVPKSLHKFGAGGISDEHLSLTEKYRLVVCLLTWNSPATGTASTVNIQGTLQLQMSILSRQNQSARF